MTLRWRNVIIIIVMIVGWVRQSPAYDWTRSVNGLSGIVTERLVISTDVPVVANGKKTIPSIMLTCSGDKRLVISLDFHTIVPELFLYNIDSKGMQLISFSRPEFLLQNYSPTAITTFRKSSFLSLLRGKELKMQPHIYYDRDQEFGISRFDTENKEDLQKFMGSCFGRKTQLPPGIDFELEDVIMVMEDENIISIKESIHFLKMYDEYMDSSVSDELFFSIRQYGNLKGKNGSNILKEMYYDKRIPDNIRKKYSSGWHMLTLSP